MATEQEALSHELVAEAEPRYLRRQKPVEVRKRKFGKRTWPFYRRALLVSAVALAGGFVIYEAADFFLYSPRVTLASLDQVEIAGNHYLARQTILEKFSGDAGHSILRVPLDGRRASLEGIPWVDHAIVSRIWPNRIRVEITERTPVAFLRNGGDLGLIDAHGVVLDLPSAGDFKFPVVSGVTDTQPGLDREQRVGRYMELLRDVSDVKPGAADHISEVDLSDPSDVRATLAGLNQMGIEGLDDQGPVLVHFGDRDFATKFRVFIENVGQWRATAGRVDSVDLRFSKQVVVNPESNTSNSSAMNATARTKPN